jgi:hypothetical protein
MSDLKRKFDKISDMEEVYDKIQELFEVYKITMKKYQENPDIIIPVFEKVSHLFDSDDECYETIIDLIH